MYVCIFSTELSHLLKIIMYSNDVVLKRKEKSVLHGKVKSVHSDNEPSFA